MVHFDLPVLLDRANITAIFSGMLKVVQRKIAAFLH